MMLSYICTALGRKSDSSSFLQVLSKSNVILHTKAIYSITCMDKSSMESSLFSQEPSVFIFRLNQP